MTGTLASETRLDRVQSLARALGLLDELARQPEGINLTAIAEIVGLPRSTSHRLLSTMNSLSYVEFDSSSNRWLLGRQAYMLGQAFVRSRDLGRLLRPTLRNIMRDAGETVSVSVARDDGVEYIDQSRPANAQGSPSSPKLSRLPFHASAAGKAILAHSDPCSAERLFETAPPTSFTANTIVAKQSLFGELAQIRALGYAVDDQEHRAGVRCVAAPIFDSAGKVRGSLSISASVARMPDSRIGALGLALSAPARRLSRTTGDLIAA